ncbi:MAG: aldolase/citrate lyase family protein [Rhodococcus sp. (in: high G+C Gram-positive bacteria)]|nr:aldolase/citrate lyase family protein [Rhodococcus sp. (in: high G+C Gram-positive bacteria)]
MNRPSIPVSHALARSWLLCPASTEAALVTARGSAADVVLLDLEDGLAHRAKSGGRDVVIADIANPDTSTWVRINDASSSNWELDMGALAGKAGLAGVMLAKAESADDVDRTSRALGREVPVVALIESAKGLSAAEIIAQHPATVRLAFGIGDYRRDAGAGRSPIALSFPRTQLVLASRLANIASPIDGPALTTDEGELITDCGSSTEMGMSGKLCLTADHTHVINLQFSPTPEDIEWAGNVVAALGENGSHITDGSDLPNLARAQKIQARARSFALTV